MGQHNEQSRYHLRPVSCKRHRTRATRAGQLTSLQLPEMQETRERQALAQLVAKQGYLIDRRLSRTRDKISQPNSPLDYLGAPASYCIQLPDANVSSISLAIRCASQATRDSQRETLTQPAVSYHPGWSIHL